MKVLQVTNDLGESSGVATFVRHINAELNELGVDSFIVCKENGFAKELHESLPDIVHIHGLWCRLHHAAVQWARSHRIPVVWSIHGMTAPWALRHKWWKKFPAWFLYQRRDLRQALAIHCTTDLEVEWNKELKLPPSFVVPLGTDLFQFEGDEKASIRSDSGCFRVLFVGRIHPVKGLANLIMAAGLLTQNSDIHFSFRLVGPDQAGHQAELEALCRQMNLINVTFVGAKHGFELAKEYGACDVLILPSFTENFGGVVIDALSHCRPVIASRFSPWKILSDRRCGWWVDNSPQSLAETLISVAKMTPQERRRWGLRGKQLVEESYTWPVVGKALFEQYRRLLGHQN